MLSRPVDPLIDALISYVGPDAHKFVAIEVGGASRQLPALEIGEQCVVFGSAESSVTIETAAGQLRQEKPSFHSDNEAYEIVYVLKGSMIQQGQREVVGRGVSVVDMHTGIGRMVGLPAGWLDRQERLINQALQPLKVGESVELAQLSARVDGDSFDALNWITGQLFQWRRSTNVPIYLRAEAGKGKSTILAETARRELRACSGPLPIFVPMRSIQRGVGISWEEIVSTVGVVGSDAESLKAAVRSGLVVPLLDGLDEVSGRYDPTVVQGIVQIILQELRTDKSRLLVSGRTTEAGSIPAENALEVGLELPDSDDESFQRYCEIVVGYIADEWPQLQKQIPEPPFTQTEVPETTSTRGERETIVNWLKRVFGDLGKERSLFFVQSLACIGRHYQLAGNQPFLIPSREEPATRPPLFDVCDLAASLACVREQEKIEDLAHDHFTPREQVELLTWLALRSSAAESEQDEMPRPNELASDVFGIDPVNQNELFTAVVRQLQKHALLFASGTGNVRAGAWRPQFLSDWVRAALIVRAWLHRDRMLGDGTKIASLIVPKAERAQYAFRYLIPEMVEKDEFDGLRKLTTVLLEHVEAGSPEASSNYWSLYASLSQSGRLLMEEVPERTSEFTDLSELSVGDVGFPESFGGNLQFYVGCEFSDCEFQHNEFNQCDFGEATFHNCRCTNVSFQKCDGPIIFEGCQFQDVEFLNGQASSLPVYLFEDCSFKENCRIYQGAPPGAGETYEPIASFRGCTVEGSVKEFLGGNWLGIDRLPIDGLRKAADESDVDAEIRALRALLKPFFPRQAGPGDQRQARGYIRSTSVGRGVWPEGSPDGSRLQELLLSEGFSRGGREGHIYAPWASIVESGEEAYEMRRDMLRFLRNNELGPYTRRLLEKLRRAADW